jgi:error-prone DNA polymerase
MSSYVELQVTTHYSFLRGASSPNDLFATAAGLGLPALGIVDRNSVAGIVRARRAARDTGLRMIAGCRLDLACGASLLVWPEDRTGWSNLTRLLTIGKERGGKGRCILHWDDVADHAAGLIAALVPDLPDDGTTAEMNRLRGIFADRGYCTLSLRRRPRDHERIAALHAAACATGLMPLATGDVLYAGPDNRMLQDVMTCIREKVTINQLGFRRERHADRHLKSAEEMVRRFKRWPDAIAATGELAARIGFTLDDLRYQYPDESEPGLDEQQTLEKQVWTAVAERFPDHPPALVKQLDHELALIAELRYAPYFLTVHSIVRFARSTDPVVSGDPPKIPILCQGRGSAANSAVCYVLGITSIDPIKSGLLFERFISTARQEPPDIDVDFEHERREEVIQWVYRTYGRTRAALTATVICYRPRGAMREVGKALGLSEDLISALSTQLSGWGEDGPGEREIKALNLNADDYRLILAFNLARQLLHSPRHLSQHPGGFVLTRDRLDSLVPIEPAAMADRQVIEWDKDDIDDLKFMKVDVLGLGMLGCLSRAFALLETYRPGVPRNLVDIPQDDPSTYTMIQRADTLGVFQIESRAQMSMLPRLKPNHLYDLTIQIAIVRPGPIQGDMVHPYLRRREGKERAVYPNDALYQVLGKTLGVPLFQEQAMLVAIKGAGFTPEEADKLRRSMATFKVTGGVQHFREKLVSGMVDNGYRQDFAERTVKQIEGFGSYGFPESHAASFAILAYASSWLKCHHPAIFACALLNAQPMGFYAPAQIVGDARDHRVEVRPVCVNASRWDCTLEPIADGELALRLGMRMVKGLSNAAAADLIAARGDRPFASVTAAWERSGIGAAPLTRLAEADAFHALQVDRRQAIWTLNGLDDAPLPLFAAIETSVESEPAVALKPLTAGREVVEDYVSTSLSLRHHPLSFMREDLQRQGLRRCGDLRGLDRKLVEVAGLILVRQRPGSAKGVLFITLEDESGIANAILWPDRYEQFRAEIHGARMLAIRGRVQEEGLVVHVVADQVRDLTAMLRGLGERDFTPEVSRADIVRNPPGRDPRDFPKAREPGPGSWPWRPTIPIQTRDFR